VSIGAAYYREFAAITQTLLIDANGIYDPGEINDRMLLGMKSTLGRWNCM
jgi:hypothetical protein